jgi:CBS domain-containing protein
MAELVQDVMSLDVVTLPVDATVVDAGKAMAENDIGDVVVVDESGRVVGIVTDRDLVLRTIAADRTPSETLLDQVISEDLRMLSPNDPLEQAIETMGDLAIRRLPVVQADGTLVGIVSLGDLAYEGEAGAALTDISEASPDH